MFYQLSEDFIINLKAIDTIKMHSYVSGGGPKKAGTKKWHVTFGLRGEPASFIFDEESAARAMMNDLTALLVEEK